jgi:hypothetical protein
LQPDSLIPDPSNPQAWNRYSYVRNNPINFNDPTGHYANPCKGAGSGYKCHRDLDRERRQGQIEAELAATIKIVFGVPNDKGWAGMGGLGTVIANRRTIVTAYHVFERASNPSHLMYWQGNKRIDLDLSTISIYHRGDLAVITLSEDLPESFIPANISTRNPVSWSSQDIDVAYINGNPDEANPEVLNTNVLFMATIPMEDHYIIAHNPDYTINGGDSGGGVFHNGELIGVTSAVLPVDYGAPIFTIRPVGYTWYDLLFR